MQGEHPVQLKKNKMLTSAVLLPFGGFHKSPLLLPLGGSRLPAHNRGLCWAHMGIFVLGHPKGHHDPTSSFKHQQNTGKSSFGKAKLQLSPVPNPAAPGIRGRAGAGTAS